MRSTRYGFPFQASNQNSRSVPPEYRDRFRNKSGKFIADDQHSLRARLQQHSELLDGGVRHEESGCLECLWNLGIRQACQAPSDRPRRPLNSLLPLLVGGLGALDFASRAHDAVRR